MRALNDTKTEIPKIKIQGLSKSYPGDKNPVQALRTVDVAIAEGEFVSIVGPSGCGKSTLLYVVGGFLKADGKVLVDGKAIDGPGTDRGVVFQEYALFPWLSVRNNILYGLERGSKFRSFIFGNERPGGAFQSLDARVGVQSQDQNVAQ